MKATVRRHISATWWTAAFASTALGLLVAGCSSCGSDKGADGTASALEGAAGDNEPGTRVTRDGKPRRGGRPGEKGHLRRNKSRGNFIATALHELDLTDEQRATIEGLHASEREAISDGREARRKRGPRGGIRETLIQALKAGKLPESQADTQDTDLMRAARTETFNTLHATLTPSQRAKFVRLLRARMGTQKEGKGRKSTPERCAEMGSKMVERVIREIELTAEQKEEVVALKAAPPAVDSPNDIIEVGKKAIVNAFASEEFDSSSVNLFQAQDARRTWSQNCRLSQIEGLIAILTEEQRSAAATILDGRRPRPDEEKVQK